MAEGRAKAKAHHQREGAGQSDPAASAPSIRGPTPPLPRWTLEAGNPARPVLRESSAGEEWAWVWRSRLCWDPERALPILRLRSRTPAAASSQGPRALRAGREPCAGRGLVSRTLGAATARDPPAGLKLIICEMGYPGAFQCPRACWDHMAPGAAGAGGAQAACTCRPALPMLVAKTSWCFSVRS